MATAAQHCAVAHAGCRTAAAAARRPSRLAVRASARDCEVAAPLDSRRSLLFGLAAVAGSLAQARDSRAAIGVWDGQAGLGMCELGEGGDDCRMKDLGRDALSKKDYAAGDTKFTAVGNVPVAEMGDVYQQDTFALKQQIAAYVQMDPYDKQRPLLFKQLKKDGSEWVSKYARGGNVRKQSARSFYTAVDSLQGHFSQNGLAPYPKGKVGKLLSDMDVASNFILEGK